MRKEKYYHTEEFSFLVTVHMEVDESRETPEQDGIQNVLAEAIATALEKENLDGIAFGVTDVRAIEPA